MCRLQHRVKFIPATPRFIQTEGRVNKSSSKMEVNHDASDKLPPDLSDDPDTLVKESAGIHSVQDPIPSLCNNVSIA